MADIGSDPQHPARRTPPAGLTLSLLSLGHAVIHAQSALMPLIYPIVIIEFGLLERDIGLFIAITTAIGGLTQLTYGWLTRYVSRPILLGGGQLIFGAGLLLSGLAHSSVSCSARSASPGSAPHRSTRSATPCCPMPSRRRAVASPSARTSAAATSEPCSSRSLAAR